MDGEQPTQTSSRPGLAQRHFSTMASNARSPAPHVVGGRGALKTRNVSHASKLSKLTAVHGASKVSVPRNSSNINLRKNQSETALQHGQQPRSSISPYKVQQSSSVTRRSCESAQVANESSAQYRTNVSGTSIPELSAITTFQPAHPTTIHAPKSKGRGRSLPGKKKHGDHPFDFEADDEFDDEAWEDERSEKDSQKMEEQIDSKLPSDGLTQTERKKVNTPDEDEGEDEESDQSPNRATGDLSTTPETAETENDADISTLQQDQATSSPTQVNHSISDAESQFRAMVRQGKKPVKTAAPQVTLQIANHLKVSTTEDPAEHAEDSTSESTDYIGSTNPDLAVVDRSMLDQHIKKMSIDNDAVGSDSDSSPDTVVRAPSARQPPPSALKTAKTVAMEPELSTDTSPILKTRLAKKVQIEEPLEGSGSLSSPAEEDTELATSPDLQTPPTAQSQATPATHYEFLAKAQRDRASLTQPAHPYPPSIWRDQFLSRAIPHVNDVNDVYTQKFVRRLDRRVDGRMHNIMATEDPLLDGLRRAQARGVLSSSDEYYTAPPEPARPSGISAWFSRLGVVKRDEQKPQTKAVAEAERTERWTSMLDRHAWRVAQEEAAKVDASQFVD